MTRIVFHIDRLVLHGVDDIDAAVLSETLEKAMQNQLNGVGSGQPIARQGSRDCLRTAPLSPADQQSSSSLGAAIGARVVRACRGKERS